jgi:PrtD family type I secretion system ABC transporter
MRRPRSAVIDALAPCRGGLLAAAAFSFFINLLQLVLPLYMMQVYNRVLPSRSEPTLLMLTALAGALLVVMCLLEMIRSRVLVRISGRLDLQLSDAVMAAMSKAAVFSGRGGGQALRDFDTMRQFLSGSAIFALFDAPWTPVVIALVFAFHPVLGTIATVGAIVLFALGAVNEVCTRRPLEEANLRTIRFNGLLEGALRNAQVLEAMGMLRAMRQHWQRHRGDILRLQASASDRAGLVMAASKLSRLLLQVALLGAGAYLAVNDMISAGVIIAASILVGRALAPVENAIGTWKQFVGARAAFARLNEVLERHRAPAFRTALPPPTGRLAVENVTVTAPGADTPILRNVSFNIEPGQVLGVVGPSGAGKSSLARLIVGAWRAAVGKVRLDGADIEQWDSDELGGHIGYLPQDVELFDGTVSENIARFGELDSERIVAAARSAGVHEMILRLPLGYDTSIGPAGSILSGGQRQRIGLARALYNQPVLVVLDEPNASLDEEGDAALVRAIGTLKQAGSTVVLISHRPHIVDLLDRILVLADGSVRAFGPRQEILQRMMRRPLAPVPAERRVVGGMSA